MEQLEPDFREVERARDLPPDEPYGDREADYWDAEQEDDDPLHGPREDVPADVLNLLDEDA